MEVEAFQRLVKAELFHLMAEELFRLAASSRQDLAASFVDIVVDIVQGYSFLLGIVVCPLEVACLVARLLAALFQTAAASLVSASVACLEVAYQ